MSFLLKLELLRDDAIKKIIQGFKYYFYDDSFSN